MAEVGWEYEPKETIRGWWPDFKVAGIRFDEGTYSVLAEVKPVAFSPVGVDPSFQKALLPKWTLLLGMRPDGDYIGFLACKRDTIRTIGVRLTEIGLEGAALGLRDYGSRAEMLWSRANDLIPNAGVSAAINRTIELNMGKDLFHFGDPELRARMEGE